MSHNGKAKTVDELEADMDRIASTMPKRDDTGWTRIDDASPERHLDKPLNIRDIGLLDDTANAQRLCEQYGKHFRYIFARKTFKVSKGTHWADDDKLEIELMAKYVARSLLGDAACCESDADARKLASFAGKSANGHGIREMIRLAMSEPGVCVTPADFDKDPFLFNVQNGTIDLRTGTLRPHDPADMISMLAPVVFNLKAESPLWRTFLHRTLNGNERLIQFVQRVAGYLLTGATTERVMFINHGGGKNGKTVFQETIAAMMGSYADVVSQDTIMAMDFHSRGPRPDLAKLPGKRFVRISEVDEGRRLDEATIKWLIGNEEISCREMYGRDFTFKPQFRFTLATNHKPDVKGTDDAIWDRLVLIPFNVRIPEDERDPELQEKLRGELEGILAWALQGCLDWQRGGLNAPLEVMQATKAYRAEQDHLGDFTSDTDTCILDAGVSAGATPLFNTYIAWCKKSGVEPMTQTAFGRAMEARGFWREKVAGRVVRHGIGIVMDEVSQ